MTILKNWKYKVLVVVLIMVFAVGGFLSLRTSFVSEHPVVKSIFPPKTDLKFEPPTLHFYDNPAVSLKRVHIQAFYLVPLKSSGNFLVTWKEDFTGALEELKEFYGSQFGTNFELTYSLLEIPVVASDIFVDSLPTGIKRATLVDLEFIDKFIENNILKPGAPFYRKTFSEVPDNAYVVKVIFAEGAASVGSEGLVVFSSNFIGDTSIGYGTTILAHEFGHALGMPDLYDYENYEAYSDDLMGSGRYRALNYTYIGYEIKKRMGLK